MRYLVLGTARSRSNVLATALARKFNLQWLGEPYKNLEKKQIAGVSDRLAGQQDILLKIQINDLHEQTVYRLPSWRFDSYDKIWVTVRADLAAQVASRVLARDLNCWAWTKDLPPPRLKPRTLNPAAERATIEAVLQDHTVALALARTLKAEVLYYEQIPEYLDYHCNLDFVETNFDYARIYTNYNDLRPAVELYQKTGHQR